MEGSCAPLITIFTVLRHWISSVPLDTFNLWSLFMDRIALIYQGWPLGGCEMGCFFRSTPEKVFTFLFFNCFEPQSKVCAPEWVYAFYKCIVYYQLGVLYAICCPLSLNVFTVYSDLEDKTSHTRAGVGPELVGLWFVFMSVYIKKQP